MKDAFLDIFKLLSNKKAKYIYASVILITSAVFALYIVYSAIVFISKDKNILYTTENITYNNRTIAIIHAHGCKVYNTNKIWLYDDMHDYLRCKNHSFCSVCLNKDIVGDLLRNSQKSLKLLDNLVISSKGYDYYFGSGISKINYLYDESEQEYVLPNDYDNIRFEKIKKRLISF